MGNCIGLNNNDEIKHGMREARKQKPLKILLLGSGESGKTTFMKQLRLRYSPVPFEESEKKQIKEFALMNILEGAYYVILGGRKDPDLRLQDPGAVAAAKVIMTAFEQPQQITGGDNNTSAILSKSIVKLSTEVVEAIQLLLADPQFVKTMASPNLQVQDSWLYLAEQLKGYPEWGGEKWKPDNTVILHTRVRTIGANTHEFMIGEENNQRKIYITDVGGQRSERSKWIKLFNNIDGLIYMQSLGEYDQNLFEQQDIPRLKDSLELFENTLRQKAFETTPVTLVLNKEDILRRKFIENKIPFPTDLGLPGPAVPVYNPDLSNDDNMKAAEKWFKDMFHAIAQKVNPDKEIYVQIATATDSGIMEQVVNAIFIEILESNLRDNGLVGV